MQEARCIMEITTKYQQGYTYFFGSAQQLLTGENAIFCGITLTAGKKR